MATLEDIAKKVGVSKSTVSKALSGACDVSEAMRRTVLEAAVELGYSRLRRSEEAPRLAIFITSMDYKNKTDFGYDVVVGFRQLAEPDGFQVEIIPLTIQMEQEIRYDEFMMRDNYRGALFLGLSLNHPWIQDLQTCRTPTVLYDNRIDGNPNVTCVGADSREGMHLAVRYLTSLGHKKIGYLSSALGSYVYQLRHAAFFEALRHSGLPDDPALAGIAYDWEACVRTHLPRLMDAGCTAFLCSHDALAREALLYCGGRGIRVPEELSILGFDDLPLCLSTRPALTTIRQNRTELGKSAYCALFSQMQGIPLSTFLLHTELIRRDSCAPPCLK